MTMPALALRSTVESIQNIADTAEEIKRQRRKEFILNMIIGILFFIPFVGEAAVGLAAARILMRLVGEIGDLALTIYGIVKNPGDAFGAIFGYLVGKGPRYPLPSRKNRQQETWGYKPRPC